MADKRNIFRVLRDSQGKTLDQMAESVGCARATYYQLERNRNKNPSKRLISKIAMACGITPASLQFYLELESMYPGKVDYAWILTSSLVRYADLAELLRVKETN